MRKLNPQKRHVQASSPKGKERLQDILHAARDIIVEEGYSKLSMRKVAARCGITVGNLSYYYATKTNLLHDLLEAVIEGYIVDWELIMSDDKLSTEDQFISIIKFIMDDLTTKETTGFFPELWTMANHDTFAADEMEAVYARVRTMLAEMAGRINPALSTEDRYIIAVFICSSIEGHTIFVGYQKKWQQYSAQATNIAAWSFLNLIRTITHKEIHQLAGIDGSGNIPTL